MVALSKAGSIVVGFLAAKIGGGVETFAKNSSGMRLHDRSTWSEMPEDVGKETGTKC